MRIIEIFYSIQGEGIRSGKPSVFIRLADCDLECSFCDTEFTGGKEMTDKELLDYISQYLCREIVWTGGEPCLQLKEKNVKYFKEAGYYQCIETNGNHKVPKGIDFISLSPKVATHVLRKNFNNTIINELRYVVHKGTKSLPKYEGLNIKQKFVSPIFNGATKNNQNINQAIKLVKENPEWQLSTQLHKILNQL